MASPHQLRLAARYLSAGAVISYPTESVYGLGCDPLDIAAIRHILAIKQRDWNKGLILIAASLEQITPYIDPDFEITEEMMQSWPGPVTWVVPAHPELPDEITGGRTTVAVRVTAHPVASAICRHFGGALISTSANISGAPMIRSTTRLRKTFGQAIDYYLPGELGANPNPSEIRTAITGEVLRAQ
ncbi:MAG: L-threonylcarbamoyladenylate synthase [Gammaproteobacteria bacterium]|nr:L-threonylcarbamoyladenylate synthase [Gammaproteobacteria bacterium]MCW8982647.1 L-threonylcarbamoyladenylate synthase [Gammaproteobacteria bacterium]